MTCLKHSAREKYIPRSRWSKPAVIKDLRSSSYCHQEPTAMGMLKTLEIHALLETKPKFVLCLGVFILALCYRLWRKNRGSGNLPPSPPSGLFDLFGHAKIVFSCLPSRHYAALAKDLGKLFSNINITFTFTQRDAGNVVYLSVFGNPIIVLNSIEGARELLDKRGAAYSERPPTPLMSNL